MKYQEKKLEGGPAREELTGRKRCELDGEQEQLVPQGSVS